jgi:hypothetical protein
MNRPRASFTFLLLLVVAMGVAACGSYDLEVRNKTEEVIDIYVDEFYEGAVAPKNYLLIRHLSRGEHYIEAFDLDENLIVDDVIYLDDDSKWVIYESHSRFY